ncbi:MAG TPA: maleylpyruvate isomerase family mycothiol-dependent enzyme [Candidatus Saccharimonadia bacterium]|nr:maleylpyruvate isomerase family mycothiol-dependent enzyme [Candidatus Saccharimonadia bacterium]
MPQTSSSDIPIWQATAQQRQQLLDYLQALPAKAWNHDSLCDGWQVRHVVAHIILESRYSPLGSLPGFVQSGLSFNVFMQRAAVELGRNDPEMLLGLLREDIPKQVTPILVKPVHVLSDLLIHWQDIAIPLERPHTIERPVLELVFKHWRPSPLSLSERLAGTTRLIRGLSLAADDIGWRYGRGPLVRGAAQDLLLALGGRRASLPRLAGDGLPTLARRLGA